MNFKSSIGDGRKFTLSTKITVREKVQEMINVGNLVLIMIDSVSLKYGN